MPSVDRMKAIADRMNLAWRTVNPIERRMNVIRRHVAASRARILYLPGRPLTCGEEVNSWLLQRDRGAAYQRVRSGVDHEAGVLEYCHAEERLGSFRSEDDLLDSHPVQ